MPQLRSILHQDDLQAAAAQLAKIDADMAWLLETQGLPPLWDRPATFETLVRIIFEQQVSLASAAAFFERVSQSLGGVRPETILQAGEAGLRELGLTRQKTSYCLHLAQAVRSGAFNLETLATLEDAEAQDYLTQLKGIGPWTAQIFLLMALGRADIWPPGDLALNAAARELCGWTDRKTDKAIVSYARKHWAPYRAVAARLLWQHYLLGKEQPERQGCRPQ